MYRYCLISAAHRQEEFVLRPGSTVPRNINRNSASNEHKVRFKLFFVPELACGLLMQLWGAALNGRTSTKDRICRYRCRMFPCAIHTTNSHSQSTAYWQFLSRNSRLHLLSLSFQQFHSFLHGVCS